jgi:ParB-like chromosome segregation protein Spo0J
VSGTANTESAAAPSPEIPKLDTRIVRVRLRELKFLEEGENARYMEKAEFDRLVANIRRDGVLTSVPLIYRGTVFSGNHRTKAAIEAGIEEAEAIEILTELSEEQLLALQLSHNAIAGKDDPNILAKLFASISTLELKAYSGLTDDAFKCDSESLASMGIKRPNYEELQIVFLPEEKVAFLDLVTRVEKAKRQPDTLIGRLADFDQFFDALVKVKEKRNIINNAAALAEMARIAVEVLEAKPA